MEKQVIDMSEQAFLIINGPLVFLNIAANIFYALCLIFPLRNTQRLKQPLNMLLGIIVACSIMYCISLSVIAQAIKEQTSDVMISVALVIVQIFLHNSMTCSVWLFFYYYIQIVPAQRALFIWIKKNIRSVIYMALILDGMLLSLDTSIHIAHEIFPISDIYFNGTWIKQTNDALYWSNIICFYILRVHIFLCLCIMTVSSFSTVHYLHKHIQRLAQARRCFSTPRIQSQMRVTISGISQGVLYFLYDTFYMFDSFSYLYSPHFNLSYWVVFTVTTLYISGTTVNMGIGQAIFRRRAAHIWKTLKALLGVGRVTNDVKIRSSQTTSGEIAQTVDIQMSSL